MTEVDPKLIKELAKLVKYCPIGWLDGKLLTHRSTDTTAIIQWVTDLKDVVNRLERQTDVGNAL